MANNAFKDVVIVEALRTPMGRANKGSLITVRPDDLGALVVREIVKRTGIDPNEIEDTIIGCAMTEGEQGLNVARTVAQLADIPMVGPASATINRFCGSSLEAIHIASQAIATGCGELFIAGGIEGMSMIPMGGLNPMRAMNPTLMEKTKNDPQAIGMHQTAQYIAEKYDISREDMDRYAIKSHQKAIAAIDAGKFKEEIVPVEVKKEDGSTVIVDKDDCPRRDSTYEKVSTLPSIVSSFDPNKPAVITAGNSCPINDGAAVTIVMSAKKADQYKLKPYARIVSMAVAGVNSYEMGIGPTFATRKALKRAGLKIEDMDLIEVNEAFAAVALYNAKMLEIPMDRLNVNGGAIAIGHPLGASGARIMTTLLHELRRRKAKRALITMCIGGGMGIATIVEAV